jgi:hypothetical protein
MKYLTRGWATGEHSEAEADRMQRAYWRRVRALRPYMPQSVLDLATSGLHDARIHRAIWMPRRCRLDLELACVASANSGRMVRLVYSGVQIRRHEIDVLAERARDRRTEIHYDEVDRDDDGTWVHRILFWPQGELSLRFSTLERSHVDRPEASWTLAVGYDPMVTVEDE